MKIEIDKKLSLVLILIIVLALSIGLATFSNTLVIRSTTTINTNPDNFKISFSDSSTSLSSSTINPKYYSNSGVVRPTGTPAVITQSSGSFNISNFTANFTQGHQRVYYDFYVHNIGKLNAYWCFKDIIYNNIDSTESKIKCTAGEGTSQALVNQLCDASSESFKLYYKAIHYGRHGNAIDTAFSASRSFDRPLEKEGNEVRLNIVYDTNAPRVDGPVSIELGEFYINFTSTPYIK